MAYILQYCISDSKMLSDNILSSYLSYRTFTYLIPVVYPTNVKLLNVFFFLGGGDPFSAFKLVLK
jgi:hypothetical protein